MKRCLTLITILLSAIILIGCAAGRYPYPKKDLAQETWQSQIDADPTVWAAQASDWFREGTVSKLQEENEQAPITDSMSRTTVKVTNFVNIKLNGDFKVQLMNAGETNGVYLVGPNEAIRAVKVSVNDKTLCIEQVKDAPPEVKRLIVYIDVRYLRKLIHEGSGDVEGIRLEGKQVEIEQAGSGNMYLAGRIKITCITNTGSGCVTVYGSDLHVAEIKTSGTGNVNLFGTKQVLLTNINHRGSGDINVINATSKCLTINTDDSGKIGIRGRVKIKEVKAGGKTCTFITSVSGDTTNVELNNDAVVGMDGKVGEMHVFATRTTDFLGRCLLARDLYVTATGTSHVNGLAVNRAFLSAKDYASIYFFGNPSVVQEFESHSGTVITLDPDYYATYCHYEPQKHHPRNYKDM